MSTTRKKIKEKDKRKSEPFYELLTSTRCWFEHATKSETKSSPPIDILRINVDTCKKCLKFQMIPWNNLSNINIDHVKPISKFDVSNDEGLKEASIWKNTQPL